MAKDATLTIRINTEDKEALEQDARKQDRSVANFIIWVWRGWKATQKEK